MIPYTRQGIYATSLKASLTRGLRQQRTIMTKLTEQLKRSEGAVKKNGSHFPYKCPDDKLTIGYGRNIEERGISEDKGLN